MILPQRAAFLSPQFITTALCATASLFSFSQQIMFFLKWEEQEENEGFQLNPRALSAKQMWLHTILIAGCNDSARKTDKTNSLHIHSCNRKHDPNGFFPPPRTHRETHEICLFLHKSVCAWLPATLPLHSSAEGEVIHQYSRGYGCERSHKHFLLQQ